MLRSIPELEGRGSGHSPHVQCHDSGQSRDFVSKLSPGSERAAGPRLQSWPGAAIAFAVCNERPGARGDGEGSPGEGRGGALQGLA